MSSPVAKFGIFIAYICIGLLMHVFLRQYVFSALVFPLFISVIIPFLFPYSALALLIVSVGAELLSLFPPGIMIVALFIPYGIRRLSRHVEIGLSISFAALIAIITSLQLLLLVGTTTWQLSYTMDITREALPSYPILITLCITSSAAYIAIVLWHELFPSRQ